MARVGSQEIVAATSRHNTSRNVDPNRHGTTNSALARLSVIVDSHGQTERILGMVDKGRPKFDPIRLRYEDGYEFQYSNLLPNKEKIHVIDIT